MATSTTVSSPTKLKTATVLAFERKLDPSDALMFSGLWDSRLMADWLPIPVRLKSVRGTASHRQKTKGGADPAKLDMKFEAPNPQVVDAAALPADHDTVKVVFTLRVLGGAGTPSACNNADYQAKLRETLKGYVIANGFGTLANRYAHNLANGRFLWRNRVGAEQVEVRIDHLIQGQARRSWTFDALKISTRHFDAPAEASEALAELADLLAQGLAGDSHVLIGVTAFARLGKGQEVFPSQDLVMKKDDSGKSKTLYQVDNVAGMHSQKLGNAIRTIDSWHRAADDLGPIAVEPYGSVTTLGNAFRRPSDDPQDFYSLLDGWMLKDKVPLIEQQHFVMATLVRGGVFGDAGKD